MLVQHSRLPVNVLNCWKLKHDIGAILSLYIVPEELIEASGSQ